MLLHAVHNLSWWSRDQYYVEAHQLRSTAFHSLVPDVLCLADWLPSEDLVNAVASWRQADTPACHG